MLLLKKADIALIALLLIFSIIFIFVFKPAGEPSQYANIYVGGELFKRMPLSSGGTLEITSQNGSALNIATVQQREIKMSYATCKDQLCVRQGGISSRGQLIVCLPNKIVIEIEGASSNGLDGISN